MKTFHLRKKQTGSILILTMLYISIMTYLTMAGLNKTLSYQNVNRNNIERIFMRIAAKSLLKEKIESKDVSDCAGGAAGVSETWAAAATTGILSNVQVNCRILSEAIPSGGGSPTHQLVDFRVRKTGGTAVSVYQYYF